MEQYDNPAGIPSKFDPAGNIQPFAGNTILCHIPSNSPFYASLLALHAKLTASPLSHLYVLLPPTSWHMTIFEGVCDQVRDKPGHWPADLPSDALLETCNAHFASKLKTFDLAHGAQYAMTVAGFEPLTVGIAVHVEPRDAQEAQRLRGLRDSLADVLQIQHAGHAAYSLHISLAYLLRRLTADQTKELVDLLHGHVVDMPQNFELGIPEFCRFEDMAEFKRILYLGGQVSSTKRFG